MVCAPQGVRGISLGLFSSSGILYWKTSFEKKNSIISVLASKQNFGVDIWYGFLAAKNLQYQPMLDKTYILEVYTWP